MANAKRPTLYVLQNNLKSEPTRKPDPSHRSMLRTWGRSLCGFRHLPFKPIHIQYSFVLFLSSCDNLVPKKMTCCLLWNSHNAHDNCDIDPNLNPWKPINLTKHSPSLVKWLIKLLVGERSIELEFVLLNFVTCKFLFLGLF